MAINNAKRAIFVDKDGTLIKNIPYRPDPHLISFNPNVIPVLKYFVDSGYLLIVISNQSGIAHGYFTETDFQEAVSSIEVRLLEQGIKLTDFLYCPHHPEARLSQYRRECTCRKPGDGLIRKAGNAYGIDMKKSFMIGDILDDMEAGKRSGCRTILYKSGGENKWIYHNRYRVPDYHASDFLEIKRIVNDEHSS